MTRGAHGRVLSTLTIAWTLAAAAIAVSSDVSETVRSDAQLAEVTFVDAANGWAVGDRGVIWHTDDGGAHWRLQNTGVDCRLSSVSFLDAKTGWAAGGYTQPYTKATAGVILHTRDGGERWTLDSRLILPSIARIRFFDRQHGWAVGQSSAIFPTGTFVTEDSGRSWSAMAGTASGPWLTGDLIDPITGALAGRTSTLAAVRRRGVEPLAPDFGLRALSEMKLVGPAGGWLVGDGGLVLQTTDLGKSWQTTAGELPAIADTFDFQALAVQGEHVWVAGTPGTRVLASSDAGRSWTLCDTGQSLPIHSLTFVDERNGWAVGELGTILATRDGGRSWQRQRAGGTRAAFVGFYSRASEIPFELLAQLSADEGYLGATEIIARDDIEVRASGDTLLNMHEAAVRAGASASGSSWRFPLRDSSLRLSAEQLVDVWNRANDGEALERLDAHLVARLRMWRPNVVFTPATDARSRDPLAHVINQIVLRAVEHAADHKQHADQISEAGLRPWKVQKVFAALPPGENGTINVNPAQLAPRLGLSLGELASQARGLVASEYSAPSTNVGFRLLVDQIPQEAGKRDFFSGIAVAPGSDARRRYEPVADNRLEALRGEVQRRRNLQAILAKAENGDARDGRFLTDVAEQTRSMDGGRGAEVLYQLAEHYRRRGRWELAAESFDLVAQRYANHPLAGPSLVWLVQYYSSSEAAWRVRSNDQINVQQVTAQAMPKSVRTAGANSQPTDDVRQAGGVAAAAQVERSGGLIRDSRETEQRAAKASAYVKQLESIHLALASEPQVRFPLAVAQREQGLPRQAERYFLSLRQTRSHDAWGACAKGELWLIDPKGQPPKEIWSCTRAITKPHLDGQLNEPIWRSAGSVDLRGRERDDSEWPAVAMLAYDDEFLYLAASCTRAAGFKYVASDQPRPRDPDLSEQDRIELLLDTDRDFATCYRLVIDHRGWTYDSCWGDVSWNPNWFVASAGDSAAWIIEAAIPLSELTGRLPKADHVWAAGVQRVVPGVGFQSWTKPASATVTPEGFGYLIFQ